MRFMPPMNVTVDQIDEAMEIIQAAVNHVEQNLPTRRRYSLLVVVADEKLDLFYGHRGKSCTPTFNP